MENLDDIVFNNTKNSYIDVIKENNAENDCIECLYYKWQLLPDCWKIYMLNDYEKYKKKKLSYAQSELLNCAYENTLNKYRIIAKTGNERS